MKKLGKILLITLGVLTALVAAAISLTIGWRPLIGPRSRPLTSQTFERTPQRLERGRYLFTSVAGCVFCHSPHNSTQVGDPIVAGKEGSGDVMLYAELPGRVVAPNITPDPQTGVGNWTDDQLARAIREGVAYNGETLFPMMPYANFSHMSDEDLASVVVFLRSLPPIHSELPKTEIIFPVKYLIRSAPQPLTAPVDAPDPANQVLWGRYLMTVANCEDCHTPATHGEPITGLQLGGGSFFKTPWAYAASANLTPDASGISYYTEALFIQALRTGYVGARKLSSIMPYVVYRNMSDADLKAIFAYLRTVKPVKHTVDNSLPPTYCKRCRQTHGGGDKNHE
jgi:mono/diheme cytochrome c family protein